jgi:leucyl/phenylalanyl-tRNA--protein transferase
MEGELIGGLYGISLGKFFFGESMFSKKSNASKMAFIHLCKKLESLNFELIDCQIHNDHLASLGAYEMDRDWFLDQLKKLNIEETVQGNWGREL